MIRAKLTLLTLQTSLHSGILLNNFLFFSLSSSIEGISIENGYFWIALSTSYDGNLPLNSISIGCGFSNPSYFGSYLAITFGL